MTALTDTVSQPSIRATAALSEALLQIEAVSRQYGSAAWGIRDVSLQLRPGILGLLGPNGAGKSTTMSATTSRPQSDVGLAASMTRNHTAHRRLGVIAGRRRSKPGRAPPCNPRHRSTASGSCYERPL